MLACEVFTIAHTLMQRASSCATARKDGSKHSNDGPNDAGMWKYIGLELYRFVRHDTCS